MKQNTKKQIKQAENALFKKMLGYDYEEVKITKEGDGENVTKVKTETTQKHIPPDTTVILSWLKQNDPEHWGDNRNLDDNIYGVVLLPDVLEVDCN